MASTFHFNQIGSEIKYQIDSGSRLTCSREELDLQYNDDDTIGVTINGNKHQAVPIANVFFEDEAVADEDDFDTKLAALFLNAGASGGSITPTEVAYSATITPNANNTSILIIGGLTGNLLLANPTYTSPVHGKKIEIYLKQDATGGRTLSFGNAYKFPTSSTLSSPISNEDFTAANASTILLIEYSAVISKWLILSFVPGY